jgi:hypothetical protein
LLAIGKTERAVLGHDGTVDLVDAFRDLAV